MKAVFAIAVLIATTLSTSAKADSFNCRGITGNDGYIVQVNFAPYATAHVPGYTMFTKNMPIDLGSYPVELAPQSDSIRFVGQDFSLSMTDEVGDFSATLEDGKHVRLQLQCDFQKDESQTGSSPSGAGCPVPGHECI